MSRLHTDPYPLFQAGKLQLQQDQRCMQRQTATLFRTGEFLPTKVEKPGKINRILQLCQVTFFFTLLLLIAAWLLDITLCNLLYF